MFRLQRSGWSVCAAWGLAVCFAGCGGGTKRPQVVPVSGSVLLNGQPLIGATVSFLAEGAPRAATGVTNEQGEFQLSTFTANDGAVPGNHAITVSKVELPPTPPTPPPATGDEAVDLTAMYVESTQGGKAPVGPKDLVPSQYRDMLLTPLRETVTLEGPNTFVLQLTD